MTRTRATVLLGAVFIAGAVLGGGLAAWFYEDFVVPRHLSASAASGAGNKLAVLRAVRISDTTGAIQVLESGLDGDLVVLGLLPASVIDAPTSRILNRIATYRDKYSHKSGDAEVDTTIAELLQKYKASELGQR